MVLHYTILIADSMEQEEDDDEEEDKWKTRNDDTFKRSWQFWLFVLIVAVIRCKRI